VLLRDKLLESEDLLVQLLGKGVLLLVQLLESRHLSIGLIHFSRLDSKHLDLSGESLLSSSVVGLELSDLVLSYEELVLKVVDLISLLNVVLGVEVSLGSDGLVQGLLLLQLGLVLNSLLLEFGDHVVSQSEVLHHLHQVVVGSLSVLGGLLRSFLKSVDLS